MIRIAKAIFTARSIILLGAFFGVGAARGLACEICGCGNNNFQIGILPTFSKGFFGMRYSTSQFHSSMKSNPSQFSYDYYKTTELWGGLNLGKFQVMAFLPYFHGRKVSDDGTTISKGIGDALVLVNYKLLGSTVLNKSETRTVRNELYLGGGIKLPTGVNQLDTSNPDFNIGDFNSQAGTGSIDYLLNVTHSLMWNKSGIVTNVAYRVNGSNKQEYRFGNRSYLNMAYYYSFNVSNTKFKPNVGISYQRNAINTYEGTDIENSDGYNFNSVAGLNILYNKIGISAMAFVPMAQNMYDGQTKLQSRYIVGLTYSF